MAELKKLVRRRNIPLSRYRKMIGRLRFAALAEPAGRVLITSLNMALCHDAPTIVNKKKGPVHNVLLDWFKLIEDLDKRPTSVHEIVTGKVDLYRYCDTYCPLGMKYALFLNAPILNLSIPLES